MSSSSDLDVVRRSTLATLGEIVDGENAFKRAGIDVSDPEEWMQLRDIIGRIERRLAASVVKPESAA